MVLYENLIKLSFSSISLSPLLRSLAKRVEAGQVGAKVEHLLAWFDTGDWIGQASSGPQERCKGPGSGPQVDQA